MKFARCGTYRARPSTLVATHKCVSQEEWLKQNPNHIVNVELINRQPYLILSPDIPYGDVRNRVRELVKEKEKYSNKLTLHEYLEGASGKHHILIVKMTPVGKDTSAMYAGYAYVNAFRKEYVYVPLAVGFPDFVEKHPLTTEVRDITDWVGHRLVKETVFIRSIAPIELRYVTPLVWLELTPTTKGNYTSDLKVVGFNRDAHFRKNSTLKNLYYSNTPGMFNIPMTQVHLDETVMKDYLYVRTTDGMFFLGKPK